MGAESPSPGLHLRCNPTSPRKRRGEVIPNEQRLMAFYIVQFLTGLASAASLFLVASGLSIIFGVTRIVNFAHGAFYMLGAYVAYTSIERCGPTLGFWPAALLACVVVAGIGALVEMTLLRRIYD